MIINIRGTGGSGKSWVVRQMIDKFGATTYDKSILGHILNNNTFILGPYAKEWGGGFDNLSKEERDQDNVQRVIERQVSIFGADVVNRNHSQGQIQEIVERQSLNVIFEGLLISGIYGRYREQARRLPDFRWVILTTPLEQCIENTKKRRMLRGKSPEFDPTQTANKYKAVRSVCYKARVDGMKVFQVTSNEAVDLISEWIK